VTPAFLQQSPLGVRQYLPLDRPQDCRKAAVLLQPLQILHTVAASQVQKNQRQYHLDVEPTLRASHMDVPADCCAKTNGLDQIKIQRQAR
jgi:hypothetical protein